MTTPGKSCAICGKGYQKSFSRSHSMQATLRRLKPNLQWLKVSGSKRIHACAKCIKSANQKKIKSTVA